MFKFLLSRYFERGCVVLGKVESGTLRVGDEVIVAPTKKKAKVEEIVIGETKVIILNLFPIDL